MKRVSNNSQGSRCLPCDRQEHHSWFHFWTNSDHPAAGGMDDFGIGCRFDEAEDFICLGELHRDGSHQIMGVVPPPSFSSSREAPY